MVQQAEALVSEIGPSLDGSEQSLQHLDDHLSSFSTKLDIPTEKTIPSIAYAGIVIISNIGGSWHINESTQDIAIKLSETHNQRIVSLSEWFTDEDDDTSTPLEKSTMLYSTLKVQLGLPESLDTQPQDWSIPCLDSILGKAREELNQLTEISIDQIGKGIMLVFVLIAGADGNIDAKEIKAFNNYLANAQGKRSELFKNAVGLMMNDPEMQSSTDIDSSIVIVNRLIAVRESAEKFAPDQCDVFCNELYEMAVDIAKSSGGFLGIKSIDKAEKSALSLIKMALKIRP